MAAKRSRNLHIAMFPWLAFGHILPYLELSKLIANKGHRISFISTPRNIDRLPKLPPSLSSSITLVKIPLPKIAELPENAEATTDINGAQMSHLELAFDGMESGLARFLDEARPDWIIYDYAAFWVPPIATRLGVSRAFFSIINAWFIAFLGPTKSLISGSDNRVSPQDFTVPPKWVKFETDVAYRHFEAEFMVGSRIKNDSGYAPFYRIGKVISESEAILVRDCYEFDPEWLMALQDLHQIRVIPVGLMPPANPQDDGNSKDGEIWISIGNWLTGQAKKSVIYVALGTEATPSQDQITELAHGLELSGVPFLWVLRQASQSSEPGSVNLPSGFEDRVRGRGIVWKSWAPQLKILSHDSVGGFLTHCGWSSIIEGLVNGLPMITLPFIVDQGLNSRVVAGKQLGFEIPRNELNGSYTRSSVAVSVKLVMVEDEGKKFREKAEEMRTTFGDANLQSGYINKFVEFLQHKN